jgi:hypothetical protein
LAASVRADAGLADRLLVRRTLARGDGRIKAWFEALMSQ